MSARTINLTEHDDVDPDDVAVTVRTWTPGDNKVTRADLTKVEVIELIAMLSAAVSLTYVVRGDGSLGPVRT